MMQLSHEPLPDTQDITNCRHQHRCASHAARCPAQILSCNCACHFLRYSSDSAPNLCPDSRPHTCPDSTIHTMLNPAGGQTPLNGAGHRRPTPALTLPCRKSRQSGGVVVKPQLQCKVLGVRPQAVEELLNYPCPLQPHPQMHVYTGHRRLYQHSEGAG